MKTHHSILRVCILLFSFFSLISVFGQTYTMGRESFISWDEFVANYFDEIGTSALNDEKSSWQTEALERLEELHNNPININLAQREDLLQIPILTEAQVDSILSYRSHKHLLRSLGELQWISGLSYATRCQLSLFAFAGDTIARKDPLYKRFFKGKHEIISRLDIPLYNRNGNRDFTNEDLQKHPNQYYLGSPMANTTRYRYRWQKDIAYGITLQKDSGEPFAAHKNYPYDYNSLYLYYRPQSHRYALWLGDYNINIGEGLLMGGSFFNGTLQLVENSTIKQKEIRPHTSSDESNYFRGIACSVRFADSWRLSAFASYRKMDGTIKDDSVTSIKTDGQHRTLTELATKRSFGNMVLGTRLSYTKINWHIGASTYWSHYSLPIEPSLRAYNKYYLRGNIAAGVSSDYSWRSPKWNLQGEISMDKDWHAAATHTLRYTPNGNTTFLLQQRSFSQKHVSPFGNTLQEGSKIQNEHGLIFGASFRPLNKIRMTTYIDAYYHPYPTYTASKASKGCSFFLLTKYGATPHHYFTLRYKTKAEEQNITGHKGMLQYVTSHKVRLTGNYTSPRFSTNMAIDFTAVTRQTSASSFGWMLSSRSKIAIAKRWTLHCFGAVFFTDDYAARLYAYEPQLQYAASFPTFAYHGARWAGVCQWKICSKGYLSLRYGWTKYFNRDTISSGAQQINASHKHDLSVQTGWLF